MRYTPSNTKPNKLGQTSKSSCDVCGYQNEAVAISDMPRLADYLINFSKKPINLFEKILGTRQLQSQVCTSSCLPTIDINKHTPELVPIPSLPLSPTW